MATSLQTSLRPFMANSAASRPRKCRTVTSATLERENSPVHHALVGLTAAATVLALGAGPSIAEPKLPPLDTDPNRCQRAFVGNTLGMANAVSDKLLDLRYCDLSGKDLTGKALPGALLVGTNLSNTNMSEAVLSKAYAVDVNMAGADLTNAVVDRVIFTNANLAGVKFVNAVVTGSTFENANLEGVDFEDALIGSEDAKRLCLNPTLKGESRLQVGCRK